MSETQNELENEQQDYNRNRMRLQRVAEYLDKSLAQPDPLRAIIAATNSDLLTLGIYLQAALKGAMASGPATIERASSLAPTIDATLRVSRQCERFANFDRRQAAQKESLPPDTAGGNP